MNSKKYPSTARAAGYGILTCIVLVTTLMPPLRAFAVSGWNPTLIVNTESFQQIDSGDGTTTVDLQFGNATSMLRLLTTGTFQFNKSLSVLGGISGSYLTIDHQANISGSLVVRGSVTAQGGFSGSSVFGYNLNNSTSATSGSVLISRTSGEPEWKDPSGAMTWYLDGDIATGASQGATVIMPFSMTLTDVDLVIKTAPSGSSLIVDINEGGTTLFSTRPEIDSAATREDGNHVFSDTVLAAGATITLDIDQVGSSTAGNGLTIMLKGRRHY